MRPPEPPGSPKDGALDEATVKLRFLADLAAAGIILQPGRAEDTASDFLTLHRQMRLIRAACPPGSVLPLGLIAAFGDA